jgi:small-conductance mechanosensitive channel
MENINWTPIIEIGLQIIILILLGIVLTKTVKKVMVQFFNLRSHIETENQQIKITVLKHTISVMQTAIWIVVLLSIASVLRLKDFVQLITVLGVIFGYIAREFLMDFIMGVLILLEQQFRVGDTVTFTTINQISTGKVTEIGVRTTKVRLQETNGMYIVSNRLITSVVVHKRELEK